MATRLMPALRRIALLLLALALVLGGFVARAQPTSRHLALGNPSGATTNVNQPANYLIARDQYALSYHRDRGIPNWVSWHLQASDLGSTPRYQGPFITDTTLPDGWPRVIDDDYTGSGYDRGHMAPSADRTASVADNEATFLLTNILPQAPQNNQGLWAQLEDASRTLVGEGNELYIISGGAGSLGTIAGGKVTIPAAVWKVILVLPAGEGDDAARITAQTQVITVWTPNDSSTQGRTWQSYQTTVRCVEQRTGLDFFAPVEDTIEMAIEGAACPAEQIGSVFLPLVVRSADTTPSPTPVTPTPARVTITAIEYDPPGDDVQGEYVTLRNDGGSAITMTGWTLVDAAGNSYTFPSFTLAAGAEVRVWTKAGANDASNVYWGRTQAVWNNSGGDTAILRDVGGAEVVRRSY